MNGICFSMLQPSKWGINHIYISFSIGIFLWETFFGCSRYSLAYGAIFNRILQIFNIFVFPDQNSLKIHPKRRSLNGYCNASTTLLKHFATHVGTIHTNTRTWCSEHPSIRRDLLFWIQVQRKEEKINLVQFCSLYCNFTTPPPFVQFPKPFFFFIFLYQNPFGTQWAEILLFEKLIVDRDVEMRSEPSKAFFLETDFKRQAKILTS